MRDIIGILGTPIDRLDTAQALERLEAFITSRRFHQVATANTNFLVNGLFDPELRHVLRTADMVVPDGMLVVWAARWLHSCLLERVTGADLVPKLAALSSKKGYRIFMLGGKEENAFKAKANLEETYPGVQIVGCYSPPPSSIILMDNTLILRKIAEAQADILLVAFGNPKQEKWIHLHREALDELNISVCIGVGGTFDFLSGAVPRAPRWMQEYGLEFLWRFMHDPVRLGKRYGHDFWHFVPSLFRQRRALSSGLEKQEARLSVQSHPACAIFMITGDFSAEMAEEFGRKADAAIEARQNVVLDLSKTTHISAEAQGKLLNLPKRAAYRNCQALLVKPPRSIVAMLRRCHLEPEHFRLINSAEEAFLDLPECEPWDVQCRPGRAIITLHAAMRRDVVPVLEKVCTNLLNKGRRVDLDTRALSYADSSLLAVLYRLAHPADEEMPPPPPGVPSLFRIVSGEALHQAIGREKLFDSLYLIPASELNEIDSAAEETEETGNGAESASGMDKNSEGGTGPNPIIVCMPRSG